MVFCNQRLLWIIATRWLVKASGYSSTIASLTVAATGIVVFKMMALHIYYYNREEIMISLLLALFYLVYYYYTVINND